MRTIAGLARLTGLLAAAALSASLLAGGAAAAPLSSVPGAPAAGSLVQQAHGCHRDIQLGVAGWHYHQRDCDRVSVSGPRRRYEPRCWRECRWVGPIRVCKTRCR